jgi:hypothetical protein
MKRAELLLVSFTGAFTCVFNLRLMNDAAWVQNLLSPLVKSFISSVEPKRAYHRNEADLLSINHRYYIDDDRDMIRFVRSFEEKLGDEQFNKQHHGMDAAAWSMWKALESHPLRTFNPDEATFFIPPIFVNLFNTTKAGRADFAAALDALTSSEIWNATSGSRHILLALDSQFWSYHAAYLLSKDIKLYFPKWWPSTLSNATGLASTKLFQNMILARDRDIWKLRQMHLDDTDYHEWNELLSHQNPIPPYGFSIGFRSNPGDLEIITPTYEKFIESELIYFYHIRESEFYCNSTIFRRAPIENLPLNGTAEYNTYIQSSVGYDINKTEWAYNYQHSKLCLVVRGDDPLSSALLRSIRVGCLPVVASNLYPLYGPAFKSILNMSDYVIMIDEQEFVNNPWSVLHRVYTELTEMELRQKLQALEFAQSVVFPDHPESLFVPAYLKAAWESIPESQRGVGFRSIS